MRREQHFIGGSEVAPASTRYLDIVNPGTGRKIAEVARGNDEDVAAAVRSAEAVLPAWRARRPIERGRVLSAMADWLREHAAALAALEREETGKPTALAAAEVETTAQYFELYGGLVNALHGETIGLGDGYHSYTRREPYGVVGTILPWNAPLNQAGRAIAPALAAGNVVVAKPSEATPSTLLRLAAAAVQSCGLPEGAMNVVTGLGVEAGAALVRHPQVRKLAFTGSVRAGREVARMAADRVVPLTLELGGKSPNIIFADADLERAVPGALRAFTLNAGQICTAGTRILVEKSVHDEFVRRLVIAMKELTVGSGETDGVGPLITEPQFRKVQEYQSIAQTEGAVAAFGGTALQTSEGEGGWFVCPTLYTGVDNRMRIAREEVFGPVACVIPFETEDEAVQIANDSEFGLAAGVWTCNLARAHRMAARLEAGQVYVNEYMSGGVETPLGGYKLSGYGREKGLEALHHYSQLKCVTVRLSP